MQTFPISVDDTAAQKVEGLVTRLQLTALDAGFDEEWQDSQEDAEIFSSF
jgi:hypothetical protein